MRGKRAKSLRRKLREKLAGTKDEKHFRYFYRKAKKLYNQGQF